MEHLIVFGLILAFYAGIVVAEFRRSVRDAEQARERRFEQIAEVITNFKSQCNDLEERLRGYDKSWEALSDSVKALQQKLK